MLGRYRFSSYQVFEFNSTAHANATTGSNFTYMGCYQDPDPNDRDLPTRAADEGDGSWQQCEKQCRTLGKKYMGLQHGGDCFCGDSFGKHNKCVNAMEADTPCAQNSTQFCGGAGKNSVFRLEDLMAPVGLAKAGVMVHNEEEDLWNQANEELNTTFGWIRWTISVLDSEVRGRYISPVYDVVYNFLRLGSYIKFFYRLYV